MSVKYAITPAHLPSPTNILSFFAALLPKLPGLGLICPAPHATFWAKVFVKAVHHVWDLLSHWTPTRWLGKFLFLSTFLSILLVWLPSFYPGGFRWKVALSALLEGMPLSFAVFFTHLV